MNFRVNLSIVSMDLRILSNYVATDIYALFKESIQKDFALQCSKRRGGYRSFEQCSKKTTSLVTRGFPNAELETFSKFAAERLASSSIRFRLIGD